MSVLYRLLYIIAILSLCTGCGAADNSDQRTITISIPPLKAIVEAIVEDDYEVNVMLPSGTTPESYSPTPRQMIAAEGSDMVFTIGTLGFEVTLEQKLSEIGVNVINTGKNAKLIAGDHIHNQNVIRNGRHNHGYDPHVWMSLVELRRMTEIIGSSICKANPDSVRYLSNYEKLIGRIDDMHEDFSAAFENCEYTHFFIYHPALTYFARDYGLTQMEVEHEGKNPTPAMLADLSDAVDKLGAKVLLYQSEYPLDVIKPTAEILGLTPLIINPLSEDILAEIERVANILSTSNNATKRAD